MHDTHKAQEILANGTGKAVETLTVWADANQRMLRELAELSAATAKEGVRLYAELQQSGLEALRDCQAAPNDPMAWSQRWFRMFEGNTQAMTRTAERLQATSEQTAKGIQESFAETMTRLKAVYAA